MLMVISLAAMLFSCFCSLVLKKQEIALLSVLFAFAFIFDYNKEMPVYFYVIPTFCGFLSVINNGAKNKVLGFLLFWFAAYYCLIIVFGPYTKPILGWIFRIASLIFLFLWVMLIKWDRKNILFMVISYGSYLLIWGFLEKIISNPGRIGGPMAMPTEYAVVISILWGIWFVDSCKQRKNLLILILPTFLVLLAIILSGTRTGIIGLCVGILFGIYSYAFAKATVSQTSTVGKSIYFFIILLFVFIISSVVWNTFMKDLLVARTMESILHGKIDSSNMGRIVAWLSAYDTFSKNMIWGAGPDTFEEHYSRFSKNFSHILMSRKALPHAHNEILQILSEAGLVGFAHLSAIASFCILSIINYIRKNKEETICYGIIAGFSIFFVTMLVNGIPSFGIIPWIMGVMASFYFRENSNAGDRKIA
jgi:O-antigen ligase